VTSTNKENNMKQSTIMGRALSEKRWDKASETVIAQGMASDPIELIATRTSLIIPIFRLGYGVPKDTNDLVGILRDMKVIK
jgi:hypothetical protein